MSEQTTPIGCNKGCISRVYRDRGSKQAQFEAMVHALSTDLYRYAFWLCRDQNRAEDLVEETFLRAWRSLDTLRCEKAAKAWLITILRREHARGYERPVLQIDPRVELDDLIAEPDGATTETLALHRAIARLSREYREPLLLQVLGGYSCEEIAELLGLSPGAVMSRLFRARRKLRAVLVEDEDTKVDRQHGPNGVHKRTSRTY
ncbi:MAG: sigma-70 family RNA polymerase sigma factor [Acidiferrobacterales bacterium]